MPALIADNAMRQRDARFTTQGRYTSLPNPLHDKSRPAKKTVAVFGPGNFRYDPVVRACVCPAGKSLCRKGATNITRGHIGEHVRGAKRDGGPCPLRAQCLRTPSTTPVRNVASFGDRVGRDVNYSALMRERIDAPDGRAHYARRFATVEPVFANLRFNKLSTASRYVDAARSTRNGSCIAWYTISRSWRGAVTLPEARCRCASDRPPSAQHLRFADRPTREPSACVAYCVGAPSPARHSTASTPASVASGPPDTS